MADRKLTEEQIEDCIDAANRNFNGRNRGPGGQQMTVYDDWKHWLAREVETAVLASVTPKTSLDYFIEDVEAAKVAELCAATLNVIGWVPGRDHWHTDAAEEAVARARKAIAAMKGDQPS